MPHISRVSAPLPSTIRLPTACQIVWTSPSEGRALCRPPQLKARVRKRRGYLSEPGRESWWGTIGAPLLIRRHRAHQSASTARCSSELAFVLFCSTRKSRQQQQQAAVCGSISALLRVCWCAHALSGVSAVQKAAPKKFTEFLQILALQSFIGASNKFFNLCWLL